jgi:hypothetical protein
MKGDELHELGDILRDAGRTLDPDSTPDSPEIPDDDQRLTSVLATLTDVQNRMKTRGVKPPPTKEEVVLFSDFFSYVGRSLVEAQKTLDGHSETYLERIRERPHILPSIFRIPKLTAEIKFAFKEVKDEKVNLIFYSTKEEAEKQHQQSVQFDIVSVPPPQPQEMINLTPRVALVLSSGMRNSVFEGINKSPGSPQDSVPFLKDQDHMDQVLIVEAAPLKCFFLFYAEPEKDKDVGIWRLTLDPSPKLEEVIRFTRSIGKAGDERLLRDAVLEFGRLQAAFLKQLR